MQIERYEPAQCGEWDAFVRGSKNGSFLFERRYMEYHEDRYQDHSLMIREGGRLMSVLPAHYDDGDGLASHNGLTYGGFVTHCTMTGAFMLDMMEAVKGYLRRQGFSAWLYKTIPHIYQSPPAEEDLYALWRSGARVVRSGVIAAIGPDSPQPQERRLRGVRKAQDAGVTVTEAGDFAPFWALLRDLLWSRFEARPVHNLGEIDMLARRFPQNIRLAEAWRQNRLVAGVVLYESERVVRAQYIAANDEGKEVQALDLLFDGIRREALTKGKWLDLGTSDEDEGRTLNRGLIEYKESWGARAIAHNHYQMDLRKDETGDPVGYSLADRY